MLKHNPALVNEDDLRAWLGYDQRAKIERWLSDRGIPFEVSRDRIVTTVQAINTAMIGAQQQDAGFEFE